MAERASWGLIGGLGGRSGMRTSLVRHRHDSLRRPFPIGLGGVGGVGRGAGLFSWRTLPGGTDLRPPSHGSNGCHGFSGAEKGLVRVIHMATVGEEEYLERIYWLEEAELPI